MPITLTPVADNALCHGSTWLVTDEAELARHIATIALGYSLHVSHILAGTGVALPEPEGAAKAGAVALLTANDPSQPWHRDGWMFQAMSWIAARSGHPAALLRAPQMIHAHKGFDGLQIELTDDGAAVVAAVIFEDKATEQPRKTIAGDVWTSLRALEAGGKHPALVAEVTTLLERRAGLDPLNAIENIIWKQARRYRVSITVGEPHSDVESRATLFRDYDAVAQGDVVRRRGDTFEVGDLRAWMAGLAARAIAIVNAQGDQSCLMRTPWR